MANAVHDENHVPSLLGVSSSDGTTPVAIYADPSTHRLLVQGAGTGFQQPSGTVNGINTIFVFTSAPSAIAVDQGRVMQATSSDGTVNWTGTTTVTLTIAPTFDIFAIA